MEAMNTALPDIAAVRLNNALLLFDEFVQQVARQPDAATLRGLEGRFAEKLGIQPSYWSQLKSRSRQIGERLARQFEMLSHKPRGWMDIAHTASSIGLSQSFNDGDMANTATSNSLQAQNDDERFIVTLLLSYYRSNPQRARSRLLELLGEALEPAAAVTASNKAAPAASTKAQDDAPWAQIKRNVAPLKRKR